MLEHLMLSVAEISVAASVIIVLLMLASPYIKKNFKAKWRYIIWLMLSIRLIIPFNISLPAPLVNLAVLADIGADAIKVSSETWGGTANPAHPIQILEQQPQGIIPADLLSSYSLADVLAYMWVAGMAIFIAYQFASYLSFKGKLRRQSSLITNGEILFALNNLCIDLNIKNNPAIYYCNHVHSPLMFGFFKPALFLPSKNYDDYDMEVILRHELVHCKRRDLWYKLILILANAIHWFNPFIYLMAKTASKDIELSCDDEVVRNSDIHFRKRYSEAILHSINAIHQERLHNTVLSTHFKGGKKDMKNRFDNILDTTKKRKGIVTLCIVTALILISSVLVACQQEDKNGSDLNGSTPSGVSNGGIEPDVSGGGITADDFDGSIVAYDLTGQNVVHATVDINAAGNSTVAYSLEETDGVFILKASDGGIVTDASFTVTKSEY